MKKIEFKLDFAFFCKQEFYEEIVVSQHQYCVTTILTGLALGVLKIFLPLKVKIFLFFLYW